MRGLEGGEPCWVTSEVLLGLFTEGVKGAGDSRDVDKRRPQVAVAGVVTRCCPDKVVAADFPLLLDTKLSPTLFSFLDTELKSNVTGC